MCVIRQRSWYSHATSEHKHEHSNCNKGHTSGPNGRVSDELERLENRNGGTGKRLVSVRARSELFAVKGKGEGGFKGTCFKCGMRGHKADRCWQKGKGKGGKGDWEKGEGGYKGKRLSKGEWSNPGHTWDNSWYHSNWHVKTCGLEVDSRTAVEPVPYLCAVCLSSSGKDFSEPKRMVRGTHTRTSKSGSPMDFAHVNKLSILALDDNELTCERCTSMHTSRLQCQQRDDERDDGCTTTPETTVSSHQQ